MAGSLGGWQQVALGGSADWPCHIDNSADEAIRETVGRRIRQKKARERLSQSFFTSHWDNGSTLDQ